MPLETAVSVFVSSRRTIFDANQLVQAICALPEIPVARIVDLARRYDVLAKAFYQNARLKSVFSVADQLEIFVEQIYVMEVLASEPVRHLLMTDVTRIIALAGKSDGVCRYILQDPKLSSLLKLLNGEQIHQLCERHRNGFYDRPHYDICFLVEQQKDLAEKVRAFREVYQVEPAVLEKEKVSVVSEKMIRADVFPSLDRFAKGAPSLTLHLLCDANFRQYYQSRIATFFQKDRGAEMLGIDNLKKENMLSVMRSLGEVIPKVLSEPFSKIRERVADFYFAVLDGVVEKISQTDDTDSKHLLARFLEPYDPQASYQLFLTLPENVLTVDDWLKMGHLALFHRQPLLETAAKTEKNPEDLMARYTDALPYFIRAMSKETSFTSVVKRMLSEVLCLALPDDEKIKFFRGNQHVLSSAKILLEDAELVDRYAKIFQILSLHCVDVAAAWLLFCGSRPIQTNEPAEAVCPIVKAHPKLLLREEIAIALTRLIKTPTQYFDFGKEALLAISLSDAMTRGILKASLKVILIYFEKAAATDFYHRVNAISQTGSDVDFFILIQLLQKEVSTRWDVFDKMLCLPVTYQKVRQDFLFANEDTALLNQLGLLIEKNKTLQVEEQGFSAEIAKIASVHSDQNDVFCNWFFRNVENFVAAYYQQDFSQETPVFQRVHRLPPPQSFSMQERMPTVEKIVGAFAKKSDVLPHLEEIFCWMPVLLRDMHRTKNEREISAFLRQLAGVFRRFNQAQAALACFLKIAEKERTNEDFVWLYTLTVQTTEEKEMRYRYASRYAADALKKDPSQRPFMRRVIHEILTSGASAQDLYAIFDEEKNGLWFKFLFEEADKLPISAAFLRDFSLGHSSAADYLWLNRQKPAVVAILTDDFWLSFCQQRVEWLIHCGLSAAIAAVQTARMAYQIGLVLLERKIRNLPSSVDVAKIFLSDAAKRGRPGAMAWQSYFDSVSLYHDNTAQDNFFKKIFLTEDKSWIPLFEKVFSLPKFFQTVRNDFFNLIDAPSGASTSALTDYKTNCDDLLAFASTMGYEKYKWKMQTDQFLFVMEKEVTDALSELFKKAIEDYFRQDFSSPDVLRFTWKKFFDANYFHLAEKISKIPTVFFRQLLSGVFRRFVMEGTKERLPLLEEMISVCQHLGQNVLLRCEWDQALTISLVFAYSEKMEQFALHKESIEKVFRTLMESIACLYERNRNKRRWIPLLWCLIDPATYAWSSLIGQGLAYPSQCKRIPRVLAQNMAIDAMCQGLRIGGDVAARFLKEIEERKTIIEKQQVNLENNFFCSLDAIVSTQCERAEVFSQKRDWEAAKNCLKRSEIMESLVHSLREKTKCFYAQYDYTAPNADVELQKFAQLLEDTTTKAFSEGARMLQTTIGYWTRLKQHALTLLHRIFPMIQWVKARQQHIHQLFRVVPEDAVCAARLSDPHLPGLIPIERSNRMGS